MSAQPQPIPEEPDPARCPQCSSPIALTDDRCSQCGYTLAGIGARPGPYGPMWGLWAGVALAVTYVVALVIVLLGR